MKCAVCDIGSNTVRVTVYDVNGKSFGLLFSEKETAGLAGYVTMGKLNADGMARAADAVGRFYRMLDCVGVDVRFCFATASLREVSNTDEAVAYIKDKTGVTVDVISGEEEARLGCTGVLREYPVQSGYVFDIGGGSTEVCRVACGVPAEVSSFPAGSYVLYREHVSRLLPRKDELAAISAAAVSAVSEVTVGGSGGDVYFTGGTARAFFRVAGTYLGKKGVPLTPDEVETVAEALARRDAPARRLIVRECPDRVHTLIPSSRILLALTRRYCTGLVHVSRYGVREGYLCTKRL